MLLSARRTLFFIKFSTSWEKHSKEQRREALPPYLRHVDGPYRQRLEAEYRPVFVLLSPLEEDVQVVAFTLQEMRVLER